MLRLLFVGALIGALLLAGVLLGMAFSSTPIQNWLSLDSLVGPLYSGATFGALAGAVLAPLLGLTVLRNVPARRAVAWSMAAIIVGLLAGAVVGRHWMDGADAFGSLSGAGSALLLSSLTLWWKHRSPAPNAAL